jgi:hypothetical protein
MLRHAFRREPTFSTSRQPSNNPRPLHDSGMSTESEE